MTAAPAALIEDELVHFIEAHMAAHPRSHQQMIGPSELGTPCNRKLAYKLLRSTTGASTTGGVERLSWRPTVGTAVHSWLGEAFSAANDLIRAGLPESLGLVDDRYLVETRVVVGEIDGEPVSGSCDLYDAATGTVIDWKVVGPTTLKERRRRKDVSATYRTQLHLYGKGFHDLGLPVHRVLIMFLPQAGELAERVVWSEPFDLTVAQAALERANAVVTSLRAYGPDVLLPMLPMTDDYCRTCSFRVSGSTDPRTGCPGVLPTPDLMTDIVGAR